MKHIIHIIWFTVIGIPVFLVMGSFGMIARIAWEGLQDGWDMTGEVIAAAKKGKEAA